MKYKIDANINLDREIELANADAKFKGARHTKELARINAEYDKKVVKEVDLVHLTYDQRTECETLISGTMMQVGSSMKIVNPERYYQARTKLCMYGLGLSTTEGLNEYSSEELGEISNEVLGRATAGANPTA